MKKIILLVLVINCNAMVSQSYILKIDSITSNHLSQIEKEKRIPFDSIVKKRQSINWQSRLDTIAFDYAFIEEKFSFHDSLYSITERYFKKGDSIPKYVVKNGKYEENINRIYSFGFWHSKNVAYYNTLHPLIESYTNLKPIQVVSYNKRQIAYISCCIEPLKGNKIRFKRKRKERLKSTHKIQTMINNLDHKIIVSIQTPPKRVRFRVHNYSGARDW